MVISSGTLFLLIALIVVIALFLFGPSAMKRWAEIQRSRSERRVEAGATPADDLDLLTKAAEQGAKAALEKDVMAIASANRAISLHKKKVEDIAGWDAAAQKAADTYNRLDTDTVDNKLQAKELGTATDIGANARAMAAQIREAIALPDYIQRLEDAQRTIKDAESFMRRIPAQAQDMIMKGEGFAAASYLSDARKFLAEGQTVFGKSEASDHLNRMRQKAESAKSDAESWERAAINAPADSSTAMSQLDNLSDHTADFEAWAKSQRTPAA